MTLWALGALACCDVVEHLHADTTAEEIVEDVKSAQQVPTAM